MPNQIDDIADFTINYFDRMIAAEKEHERAHPHYVNDCEKCAKRQFSRDLDSHLLSQGANL